MRIVDAHNHLFDEPDYPEKLLATMDACGIEAACVSGLGPLFAQQDNAQVATAVRNHPDRLIGAIYIRPGVDGPESIAAARDAGFRMVKVTLPLRGYDDEAYGPLWEQAQTLGMPVLFHTGVVTTAVEAPEAQISTWNMHPMRIETITRAFPALPVIIAHLGIHWNADAAEVARMRPNAYVDLSGEPGGWRARADAQGMNTWLWWPDAFRKVIFGTDVHYTKLKRALEEDLDRLERLEIDGATREAVLGGTILRLLDGGNS